MRILKQVLLILTTLATVWVSLPCLAGNGGKQVAVNRAQWMADGTLGMMVHYLITPPGNTPDERTATFNKIIDSFDLDYFMKQFEESGANWLIFTIGQNTGYYCSPNSWLDRRLPGHTSKRDLVLEIAKRVRALNKHFIAYLPAEISRQTPEFENAFKWNPEDPSEVQERACLLIKAYSLQYGKYCDGWWFDGCYESVSKGKWDYQNWIDAVRAGNPQSIATFNDGAFCCGYIKPLTTLEEYHAGEVHVLENSQIRTDFLYDTDVYLDKDGRIRKPDQEPKFYMPDSQFVDGVQWHALVPVDCTFNPAIKGEWLTYQPEELIKFTSECKKIKGAVTLNLIVGVDGHIEEASLAKFKAVSKAVLDKR